MLEGVKESENKKKKFRCTDPCGKSASGGRVKHAGVGAPKINQILNKKGSEWGAMVLWALV